MPDVIGPKVSFYEYNFNFQANTNLQRVFPQTNVNINERASYVILINISSLTQNTVVNVTDNSGHRLYNRTWSNTNADSDYDPDAEYIQIRIDPCGQRFVLNLQSATAEAQARTLGVCVRQETP